MPFTFSHPAAVLPFRILPRKWFSYTGLIIGSVVPDFEYFIRMNANANFSHTVAGVFLFDLPVGIILAYIFYHIVVTPLVENSPAFFATRFSFLTQTDWNNYFRKNLFVVCVSFVIGAVSHLVWDNFTHDHGHFSGVIPSLTESIQFLGEPAFTPSMLQHISTLVGGLVIAVYIWFLPTDDNFKPKPSLIYWGMVGVIFLVVMAVRLWFGLGENWFNNLAVSGISAGMLAVTITSFSFSRRNNTA